MPQLALDIRSIGKRYDQHVAVQDLSLQVPQGVVYGLLGPNGAGKTTTIRMVMNIIAPDSGSIAVLGRSNQERHALDRLGYLPEERGLYRKMQVRRVLRFLAALKGVPGRVARQRIDEWLERLALSGNGDRDWGDAKVDELSRGMQQKVQFIAALVHDPEIVILDEPFSGLDPVNAQAMKDAVVELRRSGKTVVFSTHLMDVAERMCDAICIIAGGRKVLDGPLEEVTQDGAGRHVALTVTGGMGALAVEVLGDPGLVSRFDDSNRYLDVELAPAADPQELLRRLVGAGVPVERFELVRPSLHRIFLDRVGAAGVEEGMSGHG